MKRLFILSIAIILFISAFTSIAIFKFINQYENSRFELPDTITRKFGDIPFELIKCSVENGDNIDISAIVKIPTTYKTEISLFYPIISDINDNKATLITKDYTVISEENGFINYNIFAKYKLKYNLKSNNLMFYIGGNQFIVMLNKYK